MFSFFRSRRSAPVARERLKVLLAHEHAMVGKPDLINTLHDEILDVIRKHVSVDKDKVRVTANRTEEVSMLTVDIEVPLDTIETKAAA